MPGDVPPEFIQKLSINLDIDSIDGYNLFLSYILREYTGSLKSVMNSFSTEQNIQNLLSDLTEYYYSERLFALFALKEILSNCNSQSSHPYQNIFYDFLEAINKNGQLINSLLDQLEHSMKSLPICYGGQKPNNVKRLESCIKERFELDQLLILAIHYLKINLDQAIRLVTLYTQNGGPSGILDSQSPEIQLIHKNLGPLEATLILECFQVESLVDCMSNESTDHYLLKDPPKLKKLNQLILDLSSKNVYNSIVFLGWMIARSWELQPFDHISSTEAVRSLGREALRLDVFTIAANFLSSELFEKTLSEAHIGKVIKKTIGELVSVLFSLYRLEELASHKIYSINRLVKEVIVIFDVMYGDADSGLLAVIKYNMTYMPTDLKPFLSLVIPFLRRSTFEKFYDLMSDIQTYGETLSVPTSEIQPHPSREGHYISTVGRFSGNGSRKVWIRSGSRAKLIRTHPEDKAVDLEWVEGVSFNGWNLLRDVYQEKIDSASRGQLPPLESNLSELALINDFASVVNFEGQQGASSYQKYSRVIDRRLKTLCQAS